MEKKSGRWIVGLSGASGIRYGIRLIEVLTESVDEVHVVFSEAALRVLKEEEGRAISFSKLSCEELFGAPRSNCFFYNPKDIGATIASGSAMFDGMAIVPCSMATLGAIASGYCQNLLHRAADVTLKEGRKLVVVPRETPLSKIHLRNMLTLSEAGASIVPAMPGFYHNPASVNDIVDMMVMKILDQMRVPNSLVPRWKEGEKPEAEKTGLVAALPRRVSVAS